MSRTLSNCLHSDSNCTPYTDAQAAAHIHSCRLSKAQISEVDEFMAHKLRMDLTRPHWDIFLVTPDVENDERALNTRPSAS